MNVVSSEIHEDNFLSVLSGNPFTDDENDDIDNQRITSAFTFTDPLGQDVSISISHFRSSTVDLVGRQIWRGAFLLADYLISRSEWLSDKTVLELAAGTGFTSIVAGKYTRKSVICTDVDRGGILNLIRENISSNFKDSKIRVKELNFFESNWRTDIEIISSDLILAADVVYDPEITEKFFDTLRYLMKQGSKIALIAIERRNRVETGNVSISSPNYDLFLRRLMDEKNWLVEQISLTDFEKYFACYERVNDMFLWKVSSSSV